MWIFTNTGGFYSVIRRKDETYLTIRSRIRGDLDTLKATYLPSLSLTVEFAGDDDYRYSAKSSPLDFAEALRKAAIDIDYEDFMGNVVRQQGEKRGQIYLEVRAILRHLEGFIGK